MTSRFLTLPLAFLSLLLPDLLALLALLHVPLQILLYTLLLPLALQLLESRPPLRLRLVRSPVHAVLLLVGFARSRRNCSQRGGGATLLPPPVRPAKSRRRVRYVLWVFDLGLGCAKVLDGGYGETSENSNSTHPL